MKRVERRRSSETVTLPVTFYWVTFKGIRGAHKGLLIEFVESQPLLIGRGGVTIGSIQLGSKSFGYTHRNNTGRQDYRTAQSAIDALCQYHHDLK